MNGSNRKLTPLEKLFMPKNDTSAMPQRQVFRHPDQCESLENYGAILTARVIGFRSNAALLSFGHHSALLHLRHISWQPLQSPEEELTLGDRVEIMFLNRRLARQYGLPEKLLHEMGRGLTPSRLPLLPNPFVDIDARYANGEIIEVEMVADVKGSRRWMRIRLPSGEMLLVNPADICHWSAKKSFWRRKPQAGERFEIICRNISPYYRSWVQRYHENGTEHACQMSGYRSARVGQERKNRESTRVMGRKSKEMKS